MLRNFGGVGYEAAIYIAHTQENVHLGLGLRIPEAPQRPEITLQVMYSSQSVNMTEVLHLFLKEVELGRVQGDRAFLVMSTPWRGVVSDPMGNVRR